MSLAVKLVIVDWCVSICTLANAHWPVLNYMGLYNTDKCSKMYLSVDILVEGGIGGSKNHKTATKYANNHKTVSKIGEN